MPDTAGRPRIGWRPVTARARCPQAKSVDLVAVFELRAWARARLFAEGELELHDAVDELQEDAERDGLVAAIGQDAVQSMMTDAFDAVRTEPTAWDAPEGLADDLALLSSQIDRWATAVETVRYLISLDKPARLRRWLTSRPRSEIDAFDRLLGVA
jgi:hypothetical protein